MLKEDKKENIVGTYTQLASEFTFSMLCMYIVILNLLRRLETKLK